MNIIESWPCDVTGGC